jgi:hypothetical protein
MTSLDESVVQQEKYFLLHRARFMAVSYRRTLLTAGYLPPVREQRLLNWYRKRDNLNETCHTRFIHNSTYQIATVRQTQSFIRALIQIHISKTLIFYYEVRYESNASKRFSKNVTAITKKFTWMINTPFEIKWLFSHKVSIIFNTLLSMLSKPLYTNVVKYPVSTSEHIASSTRKL